MDDECVCGGWLVEKYGYRVCASCGGALTPSGKYLPPDAGFGLPVLTDAERARAWADRQHDEDVATFWRDAF